MTGRTLSSRSRMLRLSEAQFTERQQRKTPAAGDERPRVLERDVLKSVLELLQRHPRVAFAFRAQSGLLQTIDQDPRMVRVGFRGLTDIVGGLRDGRWLAVECKSSTGVVTPDQRAFMEAVVAIGGVAIVAYSVDDVMRALG